MKKAGVSAARKALQLHPERLIGDSGAAPQSHRHCASR